jgi:hypothetical protein
MGIRFLADIRRISLRGILIMLTAVGMQSGLYGQPPKNVRPVNESASDKSQLAFEDVTSAVGVTFQHHSPMTPGQHLHLTMGGGVAWIDIDHDEWPDLIFGQGCEWTGDPHSTSGAARFDQVFRDERGIFREVTSVSGVQNSRYTMGLAAGDFDNDGFSDLALTSFGGNSLHQNNGDGTFTAIPDTLPSDRWIVPASCTWFDANTDGLLDLYVTNYLQIDPANYAICREQRGGREVIIPCPPRKYDWPSDELYVNLGDGRFVASAKEAGLQNCVRSAGLGVVTGDFNEDHHSDLYVANDTTANFLLTGNGQGQFDDTAIIAGAALNRLGEGEAGMGVATGDIDGDGRLDLFVGNYYGESNTLYRNEGHGLFLDVTAEYGLAAPSRARLAFGTLLNDFDNDGWLDIFVANGHLSDRLTPAESRIPFRQKAQLMRSVSGRRFAEDSTAAGLYFQRDVVGRGCAAADYDNDGRLDLVVQHLNDAAALLRNVSTTRHRNVMLQLTPVSGNRDAIGWSVRFDAEGHPQLRQREGSSSYLSCNDARIAVVQDAEAESTVVKVVRSDGMPTEVHVPATVRFARIVERSVDHEKRTLEIWNLPQ